LNSFVHLTRVDPGFQTDRVMTFRMLVPRQVYQDVTAHRLLHTRIVAALEAWPGVERAAIASTHPFETAGISGSRSFSARFVFVTPGYFDVLGLPLLSGRLESPLNGVVVNEHLAREMWPDGEPIGRVLDWTGSPVVVGVARNTKAWRLTDPTEPVVYSSYSDLARIDQILRPTAIIKTSLDPESLVPAIHQTFRSIAPGVAVYDAAVLRESIADSYAESTLYSATAASIGIISLALAAIGLYGLLAYSVSRRTRELGVRIALGATSSRILGGVLSEGLLVTLVGLAIGLAGALGATRLVAGLLYEVRPGDPITFIAVTAIFLVVATLACYIPARRATRVDPVIALSAE
jgi:putative ABC transport system permease protein